MFVAKGSFSSMFKPISLRLPSRNQKSISSYSFGTKRFYSTPKTTVSLIPGDGIGPEISDSVVKIFEHAKVPIEWERVDISTAHVKPGEPLLSPTAVEIIKKNRVGLKGPLATPIGKGHPSLNLTLRKTFNLYANVRPAKSIPGVVTNFDNVDVLVIRENTEGEYCGIEHEIVPGITQSLKVITRDASLRVANHAFFVAQSLGRKKVTAVHKARIMKLSDGLFLECCKEVATRYPHIQYEELALDATVLKLVQHHEQMDVMVLPNLYGDIVSDLCAGLIGGLGLTPSANIGEKAALFEAVHGTAPDIAGQNKANPTALLLSSTMMLRHLKLFDHAKLIEEATYSVLKTDQRTRDLGGKSSTTEYTQAIINEITRNS